jgi:hypothetical protein
MNTAWMTLQTKQTALQLKKYGGAHHGKKLEIRIAGYFWKYGNWMTFQGFVGSFETEKAPDVARLNILVYSTPKSILE